MPGSEQVFVQGILHEINSLSYFMKRIYYLPMVLSALLTVGCGGSKTTTLSSGIDLANLDTTALPGVDFYQYACGGWMKNNPLTDEYSRFGSFDLLAENNRAQLKELIENLAATKADQGTVAQKIGTLYTLAMDSAKLNADGMAPIKTELDKLAAIRDKAEMSKVIAEMRRSIFSPYFQLYVSADEMNSSMNIANLYQDGLSLGEREYYLDQDSTSKDIRGKYLAHVAKMFQLTGVSEADAAKAAQGVMNIETRLAKAFSDNVQLRDPHANYHKMSVADLKKEIPGIDWGIYFESLGLNGLKEINVCQIAPVKETAQIINTMPLSDQIAYLQWKVIDGAASYLSDDFVVQNFEFYGKTLSGKKELNPRWKRAVGTVDGVLGEAVGQMYVEKYFPAASKERMLHLVDNLRASLGERIQGLEWMSDTTKMKAKEKLDAIIVKVGYPDKWRDYSGLNIENDSYYANIERAGRFETDYMLAKAGKPVDNTEWFMTPQTVNAYYNPTTNEICFPAGILQYPFFDMNADDAFNYGAIGVVIGHEMTHGFDDQGRQYDKQGNLSDWWTTGDASKFQVKADLLSDYFDGIEVLPGVKANGRFTLGENIADQGGLQVAYGALQKAMTEQPIGIVDGFTPEQRFFLSYANVWAGNIRDEEIQRRTKSDPHSLGKWRVDGALPHVAAWYDAFGIQESDPMYIAPDKRAVVW